uniref:Dehydrogenase/reductase SDR family member 11 n=1 Tax=Timema poppense TaxID=170557 RepID=A0A7R9H3D9_TIMPO|nr:unnamed protein product [Timema poppensis]
MFLFILQQMERIYANRVEGYSSCFCSSVRGHALSGVPLLIMNSAIKHGLTVLTEGLRRELVASGSKIRVTSISPGLVRTEATLALEEHLGDTLIKDNPQLAPKDIADAILFCLGAPAHVQVGTTIYCPSSRIFICIPGQVTHGEYIPSHCLSSRIFTRSPGRVTHREYIPSHCPSIRIFTYSPGQIHELTIRPAGEKF